MANTVFSFAQFTSAQKLELLELLWDDLSQTADVALSPQWHNDVLRERNNAIVNGSANYSYWAEAKERYKKKVL